MNTTDCLSEEAIFTCRHRRNRQVVFIIKVRNQTNTDLYINCEQGMVKESLLFANKLLNKGVNHSVFSFKHPAFILECIPSMKEILGSFYLKILINSIKLLNIY